MLTEYLLCARPSVRGWKYNEWQVTRLTFRERSRKLWEQSQGEGPDLGWGNQRKLALLKKAHLCRKLKDGEELDKGRRWTWGMGLFKKKALPCAKWAGLDCSHISNTNSTVTSLSLFSPFIKWRYGIRTKNYPKPLIFYILTSNVWGFQSLHIFINTCYCLFWL